MFHGPAYESGPTRPGPPISAERGRMILDLGGAGPYNPAILLSAKRILSMALTTLRLAAALGLALLLAGCDKCGNINLNVPGAAPAACADSQPRS